MAGWPSLEDSRTHEDEALVRALRAHSTDALTLVYDRYGPQLFDYCHALLRDEGTAVNVFHDVMLSAEAHADRLREPELLRGWLYALARRECRRRMRERPAQRVPAPEAPDEFSTEEERRKHQDARALAHAALSKLNGRQREVIDLTVRHGLSDIELAGVLGLAPDDAAALSRGARAELSASIEEKVGHNRIQISRLLSVLPIAMAPADLEGMVLASAFDPAFDQERAAIGRRAEPFHPSGWPADGDPRAAARPDTLVSNGMPLPGDPRTTGGRRAPKVPVPGPAATVTMTDEEFFRSGGRSKARRAASIPDTEEPKRLPAFVIPVVAIFCVVLLVFALFKLLPGGGSDKPTSQETVSPVQTSEDESADGSKPVAGTKTKDTKKKKKESQLPTPTTEPTASTATTPTKTPSTTPTTKPTTTKPKPGTLTVAGCDTLIEAAETTCAVTITAKGGDVTWTASPGVHLAVSKRTGKLKAGQSAAVTITVTRVACEEEATSAVVFTPGAAITVRWECAVPDPGDGDGDGGA
ncbi:RNA polymerase sigma factor [Actinocorallia longicatena]|uniref:RNA polymerase sigma factor n=1 Tax=Actinocorallia longicatena TaxID=111803 RepID=UPI0031CFF4BC